MIYSINLFIYFYIMKNIFVESDNEFRNEMNKEISRYLDVNYMDNCYLVIG